MKVAAAAVSTVLAVTVAGAAGGGYIAYRQHQEAAAIPPAIREKYHPQDVEPDFPGRNRDFHTAYYGEIVSAYILE